MKSDEHLNSLHIMANFIQNERYQVCNLQLVGQDISAAFH